MNGPTFTKMIDTSGTTEGWLDNKSILKNFEWELTAERHKYYINIRSFVKNPTKNSDFFSNWNRVKIHWYNPIKDKADEKCIFRSVQMLENALEHNKQTVSKKQKYSRIVSGGKRMVICQNWKL